VPAVSAKGFSTSAAAQYVATFKDVLVSSPVVDKVGAEDHVPTSDLVTGLSATTITADSNIIHVTYTGYKGQNTVAIVRDASVLTLDTVAQPQLVEAQNAVNAAQVQLQQSQAAINNFNASTGDILPQQQFNSQQQELNSLELELQQAQLDNDTTHATALQQLITQREQQLASLAQQVSQYTILSDARQAAISVSDHAAQELNDVESLMAADHNSATVVVRNVGRLSKLSETIRFAGIAFALALTLALGVILLMELMRGRPGAAATVAADGVLVPPHVVGQFEGSVEAEAADADDREQPAAGATGHRFRAAFGRGSEAADRSRAAAGSDG